tara:strand:+ start:35 stop:478 length:444 start_codon:yes stop_codon:yes gene_type:complete
MSKIISFKGQIPIGEQDRIKLSTVNGKTGYKINKFQILSQSPGGTASEFVAKIYNKDQTGNTTTTVDFTENNLMAVAFMRGTTATNSDDTVIVIFDNAVTNQDIFIYIMDAAGSTTPCNYYIELEAMSLSDVEATMLTLQSIRNIAQ